MKRAAGVSEIEEVVTRWVDPNDQLEFRNSDCSSDKTFEIEKVAKAMRANFFNSLTTSNVLL